MSRICTLFARHYPDSYPGTIINDRAQYNPIRPDPESTPSSGGKAAALSVEHADAGKKREKQPAADLAGRVDIGYARVMAINRVCVYCASSSKVEPVYHDAASRLGAILARSGVTVVYGGGKSGSMGALADGAIAEGGRVIGVLPRFMDDLEWGHDRLSELILVNDLHERKRLMIQEVDAVVALPGGCGTWEELFEALSWKRLGLYTGPVVIVNTRDYYAAMLQMLEHSIEHQFMDERHRAMWSVVDEPDQVLDAIRSASPWKREYRSFAAL